MCSEARINVSPAQYSTAGSFEIRIGTNGKLSFFSVLLMSTKAQ